jgi:hypothetical protein
MKEDLDNTQELDDAKYLFDYLYLNTAETVPADLIIGFGHFDLRISETCGSLYTKGFAEKILFTGGRGAGSADLKVPEGIEFSNRLKTTHPQIPESTVYVESGSTNTSENIIMSEELLAAIDAGFCFKTGIKKVIAVASPYRQRRVFLTIKKHYPLIEVVNSPPKTSFMEEERLFIQKGQNLVRLILGEIERLKTYPGQGFIADEEIPLEIEGAFNRLKCIFIN